MNSHSLILEVLSDDHCANICSSYLDTIFIYYRTTYASIIKFEAECYDRVSESYDDIAVSISPSIDVYIKYSNTPVYRSLTNNEITPTIVKIDFGKLYRPTDEYIPKYLHSHVNEPYNCIMLLDTCTNSVYVVKRSDTQTLLFLYNDMEKPVHIIDYPVANIWIANNILVYEHREKIIAYDLAEGSVLDELRVTRDDDEYEGQLMYYHKGVFYIYYDGESLLGMPVTPSSRSVSVHFDRKTRQLSGTDLICTCRFSWGYEIGVFKIYEFITFVSQIFEQERMRIETS